MIRIPWDGQTWNDGYISQGRFWVYRPDCPRAYGKGYALRSHVVWWLHTGKVHPEDSELHHVNDHPLDDRIENLMVLDNGTHQRVHRTKEALFDCGGCGCVFSVPEWRVMQRRRLGQAPKYCSRVCYKAGRKKAPRYLLGNHSTSYSRQAPTE